MDNVQVRKYDDFRELCRDVAELLANDAIVGWFQGRSEFGPRALGNRSILANPCAEHMKDTLNQKIKFREWFRPFAPVVLEECARDYFDLAQPSPHMVIASPVTRTGLPAVTHVDNTARLQTVNHEQNTRLHDLLQAWRDQSGVPVLLNTSLNIKGEPIVESPEDAIDTFKRSELDCLVLGNVVAQRREAT